MKFAVLKSLDEIKEILAQKSIVKFEVIQDDIIKLREDLEKNGLEKTRKAIAERAQQIELMTALYKKSPSFIKKSLQSPREAMKEMPEFYAEAVEALEKKNNKKFELYIAKIYEARLREETVEKAKAMFEKNIKEVEAKQVADAERVAGKKMPILKIEEDSEGFKKLELKFDSESIFTVTMEMIKEIVEV